MCLLVLLAFPIVGHIEAVFYASDRCLSHLGR